MPEGDDDAADEDAAVLTEQAIGDEAAENRRAPGAAGVGAVDRCRIGVGEAQPAGGDRRHHVEDEEGAHAVVAEALPHLGEEERRQPARVAEEAVSWCQWVAASPARITWNNGAVRALLISTYDLGRQPLGLAAPAAWLRQAGVDVDCVDTSREPLD